MIRWKLVHGLANSEIDVLSVVVTLWTVKWQNYEIICFSGVILKQWMFSVALGEVSLKDNGYLTQCYLLSLVS